MIRKILVFLLILSIYPFCRGQIITQQPVNDSICQGQQEASFTIACSSPDVIFTWEFRATPTGSWAPLTTDMAGFSGIDNDTLLLTEAGNYPGYEFRCALSARFTEVFIGNSNPVKVTFIQPPATNFSVTQLSVTSECFTLCPDTFINFQDLTADAYGIISWQWNFGDGNTSVFQHPNHQYLDPGVYTISLTTTNIFGCSSSAQKTISIIPAKALTISGPDIICGNQVSDERALYYSVSPYCDTCQYIWTLPEEHILEMEQIDGATIRIHWDKVATAVHMTIKVEELNTACTRVCSTGIAVKDVLLKAQYSPDTAFNVIRKAEDNAILIYLGEEMAIYRWGYTNKNTFSETLIEDWNDNFYDFDNLDLINNAYWVETSESECGECWTRSYYR